MADDTGTDTATDDDAATATTDQQTDTSDELGDAGKRALQEERRKAKSAAAELRAAKAELEKFRQAAMTDQEKAVAAAKADGLAEAVKASAPALVRAELRAAAAEAGLSKDALSGFLEYADLSKFVADDGQVDEKAVTAAVTKLGGAGKRTDFDGGARGGTARPNDMNSLIRAGAGLR